MKIAEFLEARIAEDEAVARETASLWRPEGSPPWFNGTEKLWGLEQIKRWSPARVLAECEAKRQIVEPWTLRSNSQGYDSRIDEDGWRHGVHSEAHDVVLRLLALPYADHPDYDPSWSETD